MVAVPVSDRTTLKPLCRKGYLLAALLLVILSAATSAQMIFVPRSRPPLSGANPRATATAEPATPQPAQPVVIMVGASYPGASAEEVERQVTLPLEVNFAGMRKLRSMRTRSVAGLTSVRLEFERGMDYAGARQEVINRLATLTQPLPNSVIPALYPGTSGDGIYRYSLRSPRNEAGQAVYTLSDLRALQDKVLEREFRTLPGILDVASSGGTVKRYEIHLDPDRLMRFGVTLAKVENALSSANQNLEGDLLQPGVRLTVRNVGLFGGGVDPVSPVLDKKDPKLAASILRQGEHQRIREIRKVVVATVNKHVILLEDLVEGGPLGKDEKPGAKGVVVGHHPDQGVVFLGRKGDPDEEVVQGIVFARPEEDLQQVIGRVEARIKELNEQPGRLLPGVRIEPCYQRTISGRGRPAEAEGSVLWVEGCFHGNTPRNRLAESLRIVRSILLEHPEVRTVVTEMGLTETSEGVAAWTNVRCLVLLRPEKDWPDKPQRHTRADLQMALQTELSQKIVGVDWNVTEQFRDDFEAAFVAGPGEHLLKIQGPDLDCLVQTAERARKELTTIAGVEQVRLPPIMGQAGLVFRVDPEKCQRFGVTTADVNSVVESALRGRKVTTMVEGEKTFDITLRSKTPPSGEQALLDLPVDPPETGEDIKVKPRVRLRDLVSPLGADGQPDPEGAFLRTVAVAIYREDGRRLIPLRFRVAGRDGADAVAEARKKLAPILVSPFRATWESGPGAK
jgi:Cu/Ag efflux pump CusA